MAPLSRQFATRRQVFAGWLVLAVMIVVALAWQWTDIEHQCRDGEKNRQAIREQILEGFDAVGYRFDLKTGEVVDTNRQLAYFREHPSERQRQVVALIRAVNRFQPINC